MTETIPQNHRHDGSTPALDNATHDALWETEVRFRIMADTAPVLLWMSGPDGLCHFFNQRWLEFTGRTMEREIGTGWAEGVHPEDFQDCMQTYLEAFVARKAFSMEYRLRRHDGEYRWIYDQGAPRFESDGSFAGFIGSCIDVTLQRRASDAARELNRELEARVRERTALALEREMLLREVHHRVKNGLQLISSLLSIQGRQVGGESQNAFESCRSRVDAIAQIHEHLHGRRGLNRLSLTEHLRTLSDAAMAATAAPDNVQLQLLTSDSVQVDVGQAVPAAMVVHELIVNAIKHAFPGGRPGRVLVCCDRPSATLVRVSVGDDGVGLPDDFEARAASTLGWTLIQDFTRQLGARLSVRRESGTQVEIEFESSVHDAPEEVQ